MNDFEKFYGNAKKIRDLIFFRFGLVNRIMCIQANKSFKKHGLEIDLTQIPVLMMLHYLGDTTQKDIAEKADRDKSSVQRTISYFLKHKWVEVAADPFDKRKLIVHLTKEGKNLATLIEDEMISNNEELFSCLTEDEKSTLMTLLAKIEMNNRVK